MSNSMDQARELEEGRASSAVVSTPLEESRNSMTLTTVSTCVATDDGSPPDPDSPTECNSPTVDEKSGSRFSFKRVKSWPEALSSKLSFRREKRACQSGTPMSIRRLEKYPKGYPKVACYLDSDDSYMVYRRFGTLHSRLLLHRQDELRRLEEKLFVIDNKDLSTENGQRCLMSWQKDQARGSSVGWRGNYTRAQLLSAIEEKLLAYGKLLKQGQDLVSMNTPASRDHQSVINFLENGFPLFEADRSWAYEAEDLVTLRAGRENAWLDATVERLLRLCHCRPIEYIFCSKATKAKSSDPNIHYFTRSRINRLVTGILTVIILALLVLPIYLLYYLTVTLHGSFVEAESIGVLLVSTLVFSCVLSAFTKARRHEILAAAAGYCAVLVVFVGNIGNSQPLYKGLDVAN